MDYLGYLADPFLVAKFQQFCGVEYEKPATCDQQTQTRGDSSDSDSNNEGDERPSKCLKKVNSELSCSMFEDLNCNTSVHIKDVNYQNSELIHRMIANNNLEEKYNMKNQIKRNECLIEDYSQKEQAWLTIKKLLQTNGFHIDPNKKFLNSNVKECDKKSANTKSEIRSLSQTSCENMPPTPPHSSINIKYKPLLYLARFGAYLGNEEFYLTFFPFCIWNFDSILFRQVAILWCVVMYLGQATKDYLRWPRPPWPPVVRLETHYLQEYSMPSTHAMAGTAIPLCVAVFMVQRYQVPLLIAGAFALLWFSVTCWSRLYLGVHTFLDLLVGFLFALLILFTFLGYIEGYDLYQQTHPFAAIVLLFTALALCTVCYPNTYKDSSKGDAVQIVAAVTGACIGSWMGYQLGFLHVSETPLQYSITFPTLSWCSLALLRFITGAGLLACMYVVTRWLSIHFYSYMYGLDAPDKTLPGVMTAYKFTTYTVVGTGITLFAPLLHLYLDIHRPSLFYEVLC